MSKYNLEGLGWFNFERLVSCLLREVVGAGLSTFTGSSDKGRDATFRGKSNCFPSAAHRWDGKWVFQVKHRVYSSRGAKAVRTELKRTLVSEVEKVVRKYRLPCDNYVFITNCPLTASVKDEMAHGIADKYPEIKNVSIFGESDVEEYLNGHPGVVSAFPQILGVSQLKELVQWGLHQRSLEFLHAAQSVIALFVATGAYLKALDLLHKQHFCVLSGPPKMGKTCTAYALAAAFAAQSYEVYDLRSQKDFYEAYNGERKQLFICDDVFGDISLHASMRDEWTRGFLRLMGSLGRNHKLVWTARSYVLKEGMSSSRLREERPTLTTADNVTVAVDQLSRMEKAMILYNHAKAAKLPEPVKAFLKGKGCLEIVDHDCYSPESVRQLCTGRLVEFAEEENGSSTAILRKVAEFLTRPGEAWKTAYLSASEGEKLLCTEVMAAGGNISVDELQNRYERHRVSYPGKCSRFNTALSNAKDTFLRVRELSYQGPMVQFYHPSMRDLLVELIQEDEAIRFEYLKQLSLREIASLFKTKSPEEGDASSRHRIRIEDEKDISFLADHLRDGLLPSSSVNEVMSLLVNLVSIINADGSKRQGDGHRARPRLPKVLRTILDMLLPHVCSKEFWQRNMNAGSSYVWRCLFDPMRQLLPLSGQPIIPFYIPELLRHLRDNSDPDYWGLVTAVHRICPTIVEQCVDFKERTECRDSLVAQVEEALSEAESLDLKGDIEDSNYWHDQYGSLPYDCRDYEELFPEDEPIRGWQEVEETIESYLRLEPEPDYEDERDYTPSGALLGLDAEVRGLFADL